MPWHNRRTSLLVSLVGLIVLTSEATSFVLDNLVVTNTLSSFLTSYALTYSENDFKSLNFSSSNLGFKAILGNAVFILAAAGVLSLLPESAFCFIRGTCKDRYGSYSYPGTIRQNYANYVRNGANQRIDENYDYDYSYDEDEFIEKMGLKSAKKSKREAESDYVDSSFLPAEHRQLGPEPRQRRRSPVIAALSELFFGNPIKRVSQSWRQVYQHYEDYWRFQLRNPGENYRHYLRFRRRQQAQNQAQARQGTE